MADDYGDDFEGLEFDDIDEAPELDDDDDDTSPYWGPQIDPINAAAMAAVRAQLPVDDQLFHSMFVNLETVRQMLGHKDEVINRSMEDLESSLRTLLLGWVRQPVPFLRAIYRAADPVRQSQIAQAVRQFAADLP